MSRTILITGGAGFVGSHLTDGLLSAGHNVRILDRLTPQVHGSDVPSYLSPDVELVVGDVRNRTVLTQALRGVDVVFHFAACVGVGQSMYEIARYTSVNTQGTAELLQAILDSKRDFAKLIVASSMSIYGEGRYKCSACQKDASPAVRSLSQLKTGEWDYICEGCGAALRPVPTDESKPSAINSIYALGKRDQEDMCLIYGRTYGLPVTALRFFNIYGTRQALSNPYTGVAAIFASRLLNGQPPVMFEDGEQMRDFVNVHDIVRANILAMESPGSDGAVINIGSGRPVTIRKVAEMLALALGKEIAPVVSGKYRAGDIRHCYADISRAQELLGYQPQVTHQQGFQELAEWLRSQQPEDKVNTMIEQLTAYGLTA